ncbi:MAG: Ig-like domain-containing protein, partial [Proteobacteria bacterium]|nr:Ig-like domain-containing protein [Pseudomonadota bacterium]
EVQGLPLAWQDVVVDVTATGTGAVLGGATRLVGDELQFQVIGDRYATGESYAVAPFNQPSAEIDGIDPELDLALQLDTSAIFGIVPIELGGLAPANTITGRPTTYTLRGVALDQVESLQLNDVVVPAEALSVSSDGSALTFTAVLGVPALYTLQVTQAGQTAVLPAAVLVEQALQVTALATDNPAGPLRASDAGGNRVTLSGLGFQGRVDVHWLRADDGSEPNATNRVPGVVRTGAGLEFDSVPSLDEVDYRVVLRKPSTEEEVQVADFVRGIDDTRPANVTRQNLGLTRPQVLTFDEDVNATGFSVTALPRDFSGGPEADVSALFELVDAGDRLTVRLLPGNALAFNTDYTVAVTGLADLRGNPVLDNAFIEAGTFRFTLGARDTLSPRDLALRRLRDDAPVDLATTFTRGRVYRFLPAADDNVDAAEDVRYRFRLSTNGGLSFGPWRDFPTSSSGAAPFELPILADTQNLVFRLEASDAAGNAREARFEGSVQNAEIAIAPLVTDPGQVEEITRATLRYDLSGDVDLIENAVMTVNGVPFGLSALNVTAVSETEATYSLFYLNPRLVDLAAPPDADGNKPVAVRFEVDFRFDQDRGRDDTYTLFRDITPPVARIVSPRDGDQVPGGRVTDVFIRSFDTYGIEKVAVSIDGGAFTELENPNRFQFTPPVPTPEDPFPTIQIDAKATDSNGNEGDALPVTVVTFDPALGEPGLELLAPADGTTFRAGEDISIEAVLKNLPSAQFTFDIGGVEDDSDPILLTRGAGDPERFAFAATVPDVTEDVVVVLRLQFGELVARRYINVLFDDGIEQAPDVTLLPASQVLGGTELLVSGRVPEGMPDFSDDSEIRVLDPDTAESGTAAVIAMQGESVVPLGNSGAGVGVESVLRDRSRHEVLATQTLAKRPYLATTANEIFREADADAVVSGLAVVPGRAGDEALVWSTNRRDGGYRLRTAGGEIASAAEGRLDKLVFTGTGLAAERTLRGDKALVYWPLAGDGFGPASEQALSGELLGASGRTAFVRNGQVIHGYREARGAWIPLVGLDLRERVLSSDVSDGRVFALTETGLHVLRLETADGHLAVGRESFTALPGFARVDASGSDLLVSGDTGVERYTLQASGDLIGVGAVDTTVFGQVQPVADVRFDGELAW